MTLTDLMPVRIGFLARPSRPGRAARKHRAVDEVDRQLTLRAGADLLIKGLRLQLDEQEARHAEVVTRIDERHAQVVRDLKRQVEELQRRLQIGVLAEAAATQTQEIDVSAVRTLWDARDAGLLGPVTDPGQVS